MLELCSEGKCLLYKNIKHTIHKCLCIGSHKYTTQSIQEERNNNNRTSLYFFLSLSLRRIIFYSLKHKRVTFSTVKGSIETVKEKKYQIIIKYMYMLPGKRETKH